MTAAAGAVDHSALADTVVQAEHKFACAAVAVADLLE